MIGEDIVPVICLTIGRYIFQGGSKAALIWRVALIQIRVYSSDFTNEDEWRFCLFC